MAGTFIRLFFDKVDECQFRGDSFIHTLEIVGGMDRWCLVTNSFVMSLLEL